MKDKKISIILGVVAVIVVIVCCVATSGVKKEGTGLSSGAADVNDIVYRAQNESAAVADDERKENIDINVDEYLDMYNGSDKKIVLLASPSCGYCTIAEPIIQNIAYKYNIDIHYLNAGEFDSDAKSKFVSSNELFAAGYGTPMLLLVSDNKIHDYVDGLTDTEGYMNFFEENGYISE